MFRQAVGAQPRSAGAAALSADETVIVIFGAAVRADGTPSTTLRRRVEAAAAFGLRRGEPLYVPTGGVGRHGASEASVMAALLGGFGVPEARILLEETGTDTMSSARAVAHLLRARGHSGPVFAATSAYHLPRCVALLLLAGMDAHACPPPAFPAATRTRTRWFWRLRELAAFPVDAAHMAILRLIRRV